MLTDAQPGVDRASAVTKIRATPVDSSMHRFRRIVAVYEWEGSRMMFGPIKKICRVTWQADV